MERHKARSLKLKSRPYIIRFIFMAVAEGDIAVGLSYNGLMAAMKRNKIKQLVITDLIENKIYWLEKGQIKDFIDWWAFNYYNTTSKFMEGEADDCECK